MKWFEGGIPLAIQQAKANKAVFIVFISGENDKSTEMESFLHKEEVTSVVEASRGVAIKLLASSNDCKFFSQIYPVVVIPSTFFIADTGLPLEVIGECRSSEDFLTKVKNAVEMQNRALVTTSAQPLSKTHPAQPLQQEASPPTVSSANESHQAVEDDQDVAGATAAPEWSDDDEAEDGAAKTTNLEERVDKAKRLVEQKREEKVRKEAEETRRSEMERRNIGHNVQKLRQLQKENEVLEAKMELKRDREEDKLARQRVKDEIEKDRAEKATRFGKEKDERAKLAEDAKKKKLLEQQAAQAEEQARRSDTARIQFRLPDGSSVTHQFPATDTFLSVHQFITQHMGTSVSLSRTFPRRTFTTEDYSLTLQELQLAPSAAIMVIPAGVSTSVVRSSSGLLSVSGVTRLIFAPVLLVWSIVGSILGMISSRFSTSTASKSRSAPASPTRRGLRDPGSSYRSPGSSSRQDGPIRRFRNTQDDESDDEKKTWNGNSTQQM